MRRQRVSGPRGAPERVLVAVFPLRGGGAACLQLQDEGGLRRGGVYLLAEDDPDVPGRAPRFDELFAELAARARPARRRARLERLLRAAHGAARAALPRLDPAALEGLLAVGRDAARLDSPARPGALTCEALVVACMLIFVSEEERYPRPRFRGCDVALETLLDVVRAAGRPARALVDSRQSQAPSPLTGAGAPKKERGGAPHPGHRHREQAAGPHAHPRRARPRA